MIQRFADWQKARVKSAYLSAKNKFNEMKNFSINGIPRAFANVLLAVRSSSVDREEGLSGEAQNLMNCTLPNNSELELRKHLFEDVKLGAPILIAKGRKVEWNIP